MTHNRFSNFHCVYTIIQVVHTEFIKVVLTEYSAFKSSGKMIQKQAAEAVIIALIYEKNKSETLFSELRLEDEYNYKILLRMTSENFDEIFQLIKDNGTKVNRRLK